MRVNLHFFENGGESGVYNCGTGVAHSYNEAARAVIAALGKGKIVYRDFPEVLRGKYQNYTQADTTALLAAGYDGAVWLFQEAVKEYCDFLTAGGYFPYAE